MMGLVLKYWRSGFAGVLVLALLATWQLASLRGRERDALENRLKEAERNISQQQKQVRLIGQARREDLERYEFRKKQNEKIASGRASELRAAYDSLRARQSGHRPDSR